MTKLLTIGLLLLSCGVVEAGDSEFTMPKPYVTPDISAKITYCSNGRCETTCEHKMKEAMKMADGKLFNRPAYTTPKTSEEREQRYCDDKAALAQWDAVMKECVK